MSEKDEPKSGQVDVLELALILFVVSLAIALAVIGLGLLFE